METLNDMQGEAPELFAESRFKITVRGSQDRSRLQHFGSYEGTDPETLYTLALNCQTWAERPLSFWEVPRHAASSTSAPGEMVAIYLNAKSDDT